MTARAQFKRGNRLKSEGVFLTMEVTASGTAVSLGEGFEVEGTLEMSTDLQNWIVLTEGVFRDRIPVEPSPLGTFYRLVMAEVAPEVAATP